MTETERAEKIASGPRRRFLQNIVMIGALLLSLVAIGVVWHDAQIRARNAVTSAVSLAEQVQEACESQGSLDLDGRNLCREADDVVDGAPPAAGPAGAQGPQGERGFTGAQGIQGREGPPGEIGPEGPLGPRGPGGADGADGSAGAAGADGEPGPMGPQGEPGIQGPQGVHGDQGPAGPAGPAGVDGAVGPMGPPGPAGPVCPVGYAPTSTYIPTRTDPLLPLTEVWRLSTICTAQEG